jgi:hypothetical protein
LAPWDRREDLLVRERKALGEKALGEKARRVLPAAAVEAYGRPGVYVTREPVMRRAKVSDLEEFQALAEYLYEEGSIAEADDDYGVFLLTPEGIAEIMR